MLWWEILILSYLFTHSLSLAIWGTVIGTPNGEDCKLLWHPISIYECSKMNWFGAIFVYLIYFAILPIYAFIGFMIWVCTVGRKYNDR